MKIIWTEMTDARPADGTPDVLVETQNGELKIGKWVEYQLANTAALVYVVSYKGKQRAAGIFADEIRRWCEVER